MGIPLGTSLDFSGRRLCGIDCIGLAPHAGKKLVISKIFIPFLDFIARMAFSGFAEPTLLDLVPTLVGESNWYRLAVSHWARASTSVDVGCAESTALGSLHTPVIDANNARTAYANLHRAFAARSYAAGFANFLKFINTIDWQYPTGHEPRLQWT
jgi:hypothetical protein